MGDDFISNKEEREQLIDRVLELIRGKCAEYKIEQISTFLKVKICETEAHYREAKLKGIIEARVLRVCPKCQGGAKDIKKLLACDLCEGRGEVNGVQEEKFLLSQKISVAYQ
jgi:DnaJ-class molecular chaperone